VAVSSEKNIDTRQWWPLEKRMVSTRQTDFSECEKSLSLVDIVPPQFFFNFLVVQAQPGPPRQGGGQGVQLPRGPATSRGPEHAQN